MVRDKSRERLNSVKSGRWSTSLVVVFMAVALLFVAPHALAQRRSEKSSSTSTVVAGTPAPGGGVYGRSSSRSVISQGMVAAAKEQVVVDSLSRDSLAQDSLLRDSLSRDSLSRDGMSRDTTSHAGASVGAAQSLALLSSQPHAMEDRAEKERKRYFSDSMSLSRVAWTAAVLPGFGQFYNKQYWKMPVIYGALAGGVMLYVNENKKYKPLKEEFDELTLTNPLRTDYLNSLQSKMIKSNTRRQFYLGATIATYIYSLGDAAVNYSTNDASDIKRATTLATICPGAGQIYNKSYWKVPFVVGGFAMMAYVLDWNNRGYQRFKKAYSLRADYDVNPDDYPDGSGDEFGGRYTADYLQSLRDSYRRNRDMSFIFIAGLYVLQIVDAHVDAHFKDFDISDDLSMSIEPVFGYNYSPTIQRDCATYGFSLGVNF